MYDTVIIGAGLSGLAAGIRLAYYDQPRLHPRAAHDDRRAEFVLSARRPQLRRRPARRHQLHAQGRPQGPLARLLRQLRLSLGRFRPGAADRLADRVSRREPRVHQRFGRCCRAKSPASFPAERDNFRRLLGEIADYDELGSPAADSAREVGGRHHPTRCWSRCCSARCLFYGGGARARHGFRPVLASCFAAFSAKAWPGRWPASG